MWQKENDMKVNLRSKKAKKVVLRQINKMGKKRVRTP